VRQGLLWYDHEGEATTVNGIGVVPSPTVLRHHFWIGKESK